MERTLKTGHPRSSDNAPFGLSDFCPDEPHSTISRLGSLLNVHIELVPSLGYSTRLGKGVSGWGGQKLSLKQDSSNLRSLRVFIAIFMQRDAGISPVSIMES
jgi:hypothetical protein